MVQYKKEGTGKKIPAEIFGSLWGAFLTFLAQIPHVAIKYCITKFLQKGTYDIMFLTLDFTCTQLQFNARIYNFRRFSENTQKVQIIC